MRRGLLDFQCAEKDLVVNRGAKVKVISSAVLHFFVHRRRRGERLVESLNFSRRGTATVVGQETGDRGLASVC